MLLRSAEEMLGAEIEVWRQINGFAERTGAKTERGEPSNRSRHALKRAPRTRGIVSERLDQRLVSSCLKRESRRVLNSRGLPKEHWNGAERS